jgi:hypothetical protein
MFPVVASTILVSFWAVARVAGRVVLGGRRGGCSSGHGGRGGGLLDVCLRGH